MTIGMLESTGVAVVHNGKYVITCNAKSVVNVNAWPSILVAITGGSVGTNEGIAIGR